MPARTGKQYIDGLSERPPNLYMSGKKVKDATKEPGLMGGIKTLARLYDLQHDPEYAKKMTYESPTTGDQVGISFLTPRTHEDLDRRREMMRNWAKITCGMMGRTPDFLNVSLMSMAAAGKYFGQNRPEFEKNIQDYYELVREKDLVLTHTLVNIQRSRSGAATPLDDSVDLALSVVKETDEGIIVHGARVLATLPIADEIAVYPARSHRLPTGAPGRTSFAFAIPCDTPGLKFQCREPFDLERSSFDHPLGSRFEEMDALAFFDNVLVPWERVFLYEDVEMCNEMSLRTHQFLHSGHQVVTKNVVKCEFILGLANLMVKTLGSQEMPEVHSMLAEIIENLEITKALLRAAEVDARLDEWGVMCPVDISLMVARQQFIKMYPRMGEILHLLGSSSLMALPTEDDFEGPIADDITKYLETDFSSAKDRVRLFRLAWDTCCSAFGSRQILYERFFQGDRNRNVVLMNNRYDKEPMSQFVLDFLNQD
ncbi:MAG: 4-hydroxyphenylacetate 3-monooxygenase, oxygenase component [Chloroflexi bacterium]|jgi:4-hydroxyphenylacetate 3-monooxygenase|nr:4-hydroxyphenylacetate 3-monooxygenase, oxygenase component [Dehalococcoidia bacterium]PKB82174.1 MAG: 4-hydroxyphenylacetate 3-monooxygenase, oxygenase component [SAR202 cluster bacterium MP-SInd-SRR3963457-G1]RUA19153.1 MAG: 4-hydroxyphenylacetate 3-monooxygenase, oxygenase component [Chloroflexota bacterium]|tara:strand:- start:2204 stop:3655 length:1452 start_codon:yes stop_codon:yes gene_type:complete